MVEEFCISCAEKHRIYIFGAGRIGREIGEMLSSAGVQDYEFCDSNFCGEIQGKRVSALSDINDSSAIIVIGSFSHMVEMYKIIESMHIDRERIRIPCEIMRKKWDKGEYRLDEIGDLKSIYVHKKELEAYLNKKKFINYLEFVITERCSLNCRHCASLMPYYEKPVNYTPDQLRDQLEALLSSDYYIGRVLFMGGEPLLNQEAIRLILTEFNDDERVGFFDLTTNGTIIPEDETLRKMKETKNFFVTLSNYGKLSVNQEAVKERFRKFGIKFAEFEQTDTVSSKDIVWKDYGEIVHYERTQNEHQRIFEECIERTNCNTMLRGKLYLCGRIANADNLGLLPNDRKDNYLDITSPEFSAKEPEKRGGLIDAFLHNPEHPLGCEYCNRFRAILVERAAQVNRKTFIKQIMT